MTRSGRRLLADECVTRLLLRALAPRSPRTVQELGWSGIKNGSLMELAAAEFDVFLTVDQSFAGVRDTVPAVIGVVIVQVGSLRFQAILPYMDSINEAILTVEPGEVRRIVRPGHAQP